MFKTNFTLSKTHKVFGNLVHQLHKKMENIDEKQVASLCRNLPPALTQEKYKGQAGRIGVIGGSLEYTGAPYFAAISALKVGVDLSHIFCTLAAAPVIKSYSPELIVHPVLDNLKTASSALEWIERLHVLVLGPGLGRMQDTFDAATVIINECRKQKKPLIIDADGLFLITNYPHVLENYPADIILTPNAMEYKRLFGSGEPIREILNKFGGKCTVVRKGSEDMIFDGEKQTKCTVKGSGRRCGGQGDLLSGSLATFFNWALYQENNNIKEDMRAMVASYAACHLTRECNTRAFNKIGRSMTTSDMIGQIGNVFNDIFELK